MASSSSDDDSRIPRKRMIDIKKITVVDTVRSIGDRSCDKWNGNTAMDRIEGDINIYRGLIELSFSMFKGDSEEEESKCSKVSISLLACMMKQKFDDDTFIASKYMFNNISIYKIAAEHFLTKQVQLWVVLLSQKVGRQLGLTPFSFFTKPDEVIRLKVPIRFNVFSRKRVKPSWYFWQYSLIAKANVTLRELFFLHTIGDNKGRNHSLFHGYSIYCLILLSTKGKEWANPLIVRLPIFFSVWGEGENLDSKFMWEKSKLSWQYCLLTDHHGDIKQSGTFFSHNR